jgi:hypothetical protein
MRAQSWAKRERRGVIAGVPVEDVIGDDLAIIVQLNAVPEIEVILAVRGRANPVRLNHVDAKREEARCPPCNAGARTHRPSPKRS